jgi:hypothetical protein
MEDERQLWELAMQACGLLLVQERREPTSQRPLSVGEVNKSAEWSWSYLYLF